MINPYAPQAFHGSKVAMALVEAIAFSTDQSGMAIYDIDHADATLLPHLIKQFSLEEYALWNQFGEAGIREIIKNALPIVRYKGTPWAIDFALGLAGVNAEPIEWWQTEPRGEPYTASIVFWSNENYDAAIDVTHPANFERLIIVLDAVRPAARRFNVTTGFYHGIPDSSPGSTPGSPGFDLTDPKLLGVGLAATFDEFRTVEVEATAPARSDTPIVALLPIVDSVSMLEINCTLEVSE